MIINQFPSNRNINSPSSQVILVVALHYLLAVSLRPDPQSRIPSRFEKNFSAVDVYHALLPPPF